MRDKELLYLQQVARIAEAAGAVEAERFDPALLVDVAARNDELGQLARVFQRMAIEVYAREQRLKQEVRELRIEIDRTRAAQQIAEITDTDYFRTLQEKARQLRSGATLNDKTDPAAHHDAG